MKKKKQKIFYKKFMSIFIVSIMLISVFSPLVSAEPAQNAGSTTGENSDSEDKSGSSATAMGTSMISFFRNERNGLNTGGIAKEEYLVYGAYLSNYFLPGSTTVSDFKRNDLADKLSKRHFDGSDKTSTFLELNTKLYDAITSKDNGLGGSKSSLKFNNNDVDGVAFLTAMATEKKLTCNGKTVIDFSQKGYKGMMQILTGIVPEVVLGEKGIRKCKKLYIDGIGNVWGSYGDVSMDKYMLIIPACLNPSAFANGGGKIPLNNVFAMGCLINVDDDNILNGSDSKFLPYYNLKSRLKGDDSKNMLSIYGMLSPTDFLGSTDRIIKGGKSLDNSSVINNIKKIINAKEINGSYSSGKFKIILSLDFSKYSSLSKDIGNIFPKKKENRSKLTHYLGDAIVAGKGEVTDNMYYFADSMSKNNSSNFLGNQNAGNFKSNGEDTNELLQNLVSRDGLFTADEKGKQEFYTNGTINSKFLNFLKEFYGDKNSQKTKAKDYIAGKASSDSLNRLVAFFNTGTFNHASQNQVNDTLSSTSNNGLIFHMLLPGNKMNLVDKGLFQGDVPAVSGMTYMDTILRDMTYLSNGKWTVESLVGTDDKSYKPFVLRSKGFLMQGKDFGGLDGVKTADINKIATLFFTALSYKVVSISKDVRRWITYDTKAGSNIEMATGGKTKISSNIANGNNFWAGIYWGYMVNILGIQIKDGKLVPTSNGSGLLPDLDVATTGTLDLNGVGEGGVDKSQEKSLEDMQKDIISKIYGLLQPESNEYRNSWIKSTLDGWVLTTHKNITGSWLGNSFTVGKDVASSYSSSVGYINLPSLLDIPLTSWFIKDYGMLYLFFLLLILIMIICSVIVNIRTIREAILMFLLMSVILMLPQSLIVNMVDMTNAMSDKIFSEKFNYWAITQNEQIIQTNKSDAATIEDTRIEKINEAGQGSNNINSSAEEASVTLKWMSPKKEDVFKQIFTGDIVSSGLEKNMGIFRFLFSNFFNQEEYVNTNDFVNYLYRPYSSIIKDAKDSYNSLTNNSSEKDKVSGDIGNYCSGISNLPSYRFKAIRGSLDLLKDYSDVVGVYKYDSNSPSGYNTSGSTSDTDKNDSDSKTSESNDSYRYWGLANNSITSSIFREDYDLETAGLTGYSQDDYSNAFLLLTESPFYYFYNVLRSRYEVMDGGFKSALLTKDVFKTLNTDTTADKELRDFLDLEGLFTYIIPYLKQSNEYVYNWTNIYGKKINRYNFETGTPGEEYEEEYEEAKIQKSAMENVWKMYTPWVDQLYTLNTKDYKVGRGLGLKKGDLVEDTVNPAAYNTQTRPMVFSPAAMNINSLNKTNLTDIEYRTQKVLEDTYEDFMYLINYYDFSDETLINIGAMMATFNFNSCFSSNKILGTGSRLYPQNFELKNFNYDAFQRLMLANSTGEPIKNENDLYERILSKTSIFTGFLILLKDVFGVFLVPSIKMLILLILFFLMIVISLSVATAPVKKVFEKVFNQIGKPVLIFSSSSIVFAWIISILMGEGFSSYVGSKTLSAGITDPTILLIIALIIDCIYMFFLFKLLTSLYHTLKKCSISAILNMVALGGSITSSIVNSINDFGKEITGDGFSNGGFANGEVKNSVTKEEHTTNNTYINTNNIDSKKENSSDEKDTYYENRKAFKTEQQNTKEKAFIEKLNTLSNTRGNVDKNKTSSQNSSDNNK
ncbi:hypothetical protein [Clostridioides sp. ZZV15-6597]|uniref:hypothetical protein n=1 Tax=Clostridioides sp. ZZV15-6597 TaxID=2811500 RepID=UPI001D11A5AD|nr:hypothetical protein [Clostridioides sp. ZZV15-6597]